MSLFKFFGFLFFSGMCHLISFMALAFFSGINLEPLTKSGNAFVALMAKIPQVLLHGACDACAFVGDGGFWHFYFW